MKTIFLKINLIIAFSLIAYLVSAQDEKKQVAAPKKNILKINITSLPISNYGFQFERVLSKKISFVLGYRTMPLGGSVDLTVRRQGKTFTASVKLSAAPETQPRDRQAIGGKWPLAGIVVAKIGRAHG